MRQPLQLLLISVTLIAPLWAAYAAPTGEPLTLTARGRSWSSALLSEQLPTQRVEVHDPYEQRTVAFEATPAPLALTHLLGDDWRDSDEVEFKCADGYRARVPTERILKHRAWFAWRRLDQPTFFINKPVGGELKRTSLAPLYIVWSNLDDEVIRAEADWGWPYQVVMVQAQRASAEHQAIAPPTGASAQAHEGFKAFRRWCLRCHKLNGVGGEVGPELNQPVSVTTWIKPAWLYRWITNPQAVRAHTLMPGLPQGIPKREETARALIDYLTSIAPSALNADH